MLANLPHTKVELNNKSGFTLIELILVVAIIGILGALSTPFYSRFIFQNSVANTSDQIVGQMRKAQIYSMMSKQNTSWGVKFASSKITLFATGNSAFDESFTVPSSIGVSGFSTVTFARITGLPDVTPTIGLTGGGNSKTITVNSQGVVNR